MTTLPGATSQSTTLAVRSNSFVPSACTTGASRSPPCPAVVAGNSLATFSIAASMVFASIVVVGAAAESDAAAPPAVADPTWSIPVIPAAAWPAIVHTMS